MKLWFTNMLENRGAIKKYDKDMMTHKTFLSEQKQNTKYLWFDLAFVT